MKYTQNSRKSTVHCTAVMLSLLLWASGHTCMSAHVRMYSIPLNSNSSNATLQVVQAAGYESPDSWLLVLTTLLLGYIPAMPLRAGFIKCHLGTFL